MKYLFSALLFLIPQLSFAYTFERSPLGATPQAPVTITLTFDDSEVIGAQSYTINTSYFFTPDEHSACYPVIAGTNIQTQVLNTAGWVSQNYAQFSSNTDCNLVDITTLYGEDCANIDPFTCSGYPAYDIQPIPILGNGFTTMLSEGESVYTNTTGASMGATVSWAGDSFIKIIIGSGLAVLLALRFWIVAIIAISIIVWYVYRMEKLRT